MPPCLLLGLIRTRWITGYRRTCARCAVVLARVFLSLGLNIRTIETDQKPGGSPPRFLSECVRQVPTTRRVVQETCRVEYHRVTPIILRATCSSTYQTAGISQGCWRSVFGHRGGDAELLERLIREQLLQATPVERPPTEGEQPDCTVRRLGVTTYPAPQGSERQRGAGQDRVGPRSPKRSSSHSPRLHV